MLPGNEPPPNRPERPRRTTTAPHRKEKKEVRITRSSRYFVAYLLLGAAILLAACGGATGETTEAPDMAAPAASDGVLSGNVVYLDRSALDPAAVILVNLIQTTADGAPTVVASQSVNAEGRQVPIPFEIAYDPATIDQTQT